MKMSYFLMLCAVFTQVGTVLAFPRENVVLYLVMCVFSGSVAGHIYGGFIKGNLYERR